MNVKLKRNILNFFILPVGLFILAYFTQYFEPIMFLMIIYFIALAFLNMNIKCPKCNYPLGLHKKYETIDYTSKHWSAFTKNKCANCGHKF